MMKTKSNNKISMYSIATGVLIACIFSLAAIFLGAILISREYVDTGMITFLQITVHFLSALLGCFITDKLCHSNKIINCSITAVSYYLVLIATSALFFDGISNRFWIGIIPVVVALLISAIWISKPKSTNRGRKKRMVNR